MKNKELFWKKKMEVCYFQNFPPPPPFFLVENQNH